MLGNGIDRSALFQISFSLCLLAVELNAGQPVEIVYEL